MLVIKFAMKMRIMQNLCPFDWCSAKVEPCFDQVGKVNEGQSGMLNS